MRSIQTKKLKFIPLLWLTCLTLLSAACNKEWLEAKPDKALVLPTTVNDYQALLDNYGNSGALSKSSVTMGESSTDDHYITYDTWLSFSVLNRNLYVWAKEIYDSDYSGDWSGSYESILYTNVALEGLEKVPVNPVNETAWRSVKGQGLAQRAFNYFNLSQVFCKPYNPATAATDLGLPLKMSADVNEKVSRSTLQETYDLILNDLLAAKTMLPDIQPVKNRPSSITVAGLLARIYLSMGRYEDAYKNADEYLEHTNSLLDYNTIDSALTYPFPALNEEVTWHCELALSLMYGNRSGIVDTLLYRSYASGDLRKKLFFTTGGVMFRGMYSGRRNTLFCGIATDEMYLIRSECLARMNRIDDAMNDLRTLLETRYAPGTYISPVVSNETEALKVILLERRKQLYLRGVRWSDLRRLNPDPRFQVTLKRVFNGEEYILPPNDLRYTFPLPRGEIMITGLEQNPR